MAAPCTPEVGTKQRLRNPTFRPGTSPGPPMTAWLPVSAVVWAGTSTSTR